MAEVEDTEQNHRLCLESQCGQCPSYPGVEGEALYCARGPGSAEVERNGCDCPDCPIWVKCGLSKMYFCAGA